MLNASGFRAKRLRAGSCSWLRCVIVPGCGLVARVSCEMGEAPARSVIVYVPLLRRSLTCLLLTLSRRVPCPFRPG